MRARIAATACLGLCALAACSPAAPPLTTPTASASVTGPESATTPTVPVSPSPGPGSGTVSGRPTESPALVVLTGTSIGDFRLGLAKMTKVDAMIDDRLGKPAVGQPQLCQGDSRGQLAVIDHSWPGLTVRYGSSGGTAVAVGWVVDVGGVPDGFPLGDQLAWRPTFASLKRGGAQFSTANGEQHALLRREQVTYSGPVGAARPDTVAGGPTLTCD